MVAALSLPHDQIIDGRRVITLENHNVDDEHHNINFSI